jgi:hypothetical protein
MSSGNLVIDPIFATPVDWCNGATTWPGVTSSPLAGGGVSVTEASEQIIVMAYGTIGLSFYPPVGSGIVVGAGQIAVGNVLAYSADMRPASVFSIGTPYFGLLDYNGTLLASAAPNAAGLCAGTYTVAPGVTSIRPVFYLGNVWLYAAMPNRPAWSTYGAQSPVAVGAQTTYEGYVYQCIVAGTTGTYAPTWPVPANWVPWTGAPIPLTTVTDGTVVWSCVAWNGNTCLLSNPYIAVL